MDNPSVILLVQDEVLVRMFAAYVLSSCIAGVGGVAYAYARSKVTVDSFGILVALQFAAFAYVGGITVIPGALVTGLMAPEGVIPFVLHAELGLSQTWLVLVAGLALTVCMVLFPAGLAGSRRRGHRARAAGALGPVELQRAT